MKLKVKWIEKYFQMNRKRFTSLFLSLRTSKSFWSLNRSQLNRSSVSMVWEFCQHFGWSQVIESSNMIEWWSKWWKSMHSHKWSLLFWWLMDMLLILSFWSLGSWSPNLAWEHLIRKNFQWAFATKFKAFFLSQKSTQLDEDLFESILSLHSNSCCPSIILHELSSFYFGRWFVNSLLKKSNQTLSRLLVERNSSLTKLCQRYKCRKFFKLKYVSR